MKKIILLLFAMLSVISYGQSTGGNYINIACDPNWKPESIVTGSGLYSLGTISSDHQVTVEATDYGESPQPLEAMQATGKVAKADARASVPYALKNVQTGDVAAKGEMPVEGGVLNFCNVRSGLYVLTLSPAGCEPETFKISLK